STRASTPTRSRRQPATPPNRRRSSGDSPSTLPITRRLRRLVDGPSPTVVLASEKATPGGGMISIRRRRALAALFSLVAAPLAAQQSIPIRNGAPVPPPGVPVPPLPSEPIEYPTAEGMDIRVSVVVRGLEYPWSLAFLPNGDMLVTERNAGRLRLIRDGALVPEPVSGVPEVRGVGLSGLLDVVLHPRFDETRFVYLSYNKPFGEESGLAVARGQWNGRALTDVRDIFETRDAGSISRLAFGADGMLYVTTFGGTGDAAQDPSSLAGKVL